MDTLHDHELDPTQPTKDTFVVVEEQENCFEIGIVRETELQKGKKELKILMLTAGGFTTNPPVYDKIWNPFLPNPTEEIALDKHPLSPIDPYLIVELLTQQKQYLEKKLPDSRSELEAFEKLEESLMNVCTNV
jgi:hypothetical protein